MGMDAISVGGRAVWIVVRVDSEDLLQSLMKEIAMTFVTARLCWWRSDGIEELVLEFVDSF
jgi:hypothetical protein